MVEEICVTADVPIMASAREDIEGGQFCAVDERAELQWICRRLFKF